MKQLIIARKDLNMSAGKLAAQVSHASMMFLSKQIRKFKTRNVIYTNQPIYESSYNVIINIPASVKEDWFDGSFTKIVCEARNKNHLLKAAEKAEELGLRKNVDYFFVEDNCRTELEPEEVDEFGIGRTLTCIGFVPLPDDICEQISKKYQLYR